MLSIKSICDLFKKKKNELSWSVSLFKKEKENSDVLYLNSLGYFGGERNSLKESPKMQFRFFKCGSSCFVIVSGRSVVDDLTCFISAEIICYVSSLDLCRLS